MTKIQNSIQNKDIYSERSTLWILNCEKNNPKNLLSRQREREIHYFYGSRGPSGHNQLVSNFDIVSLLLFGGFHGTEVILDHLFRVETETLGIPF
jgi:hypothetical protein